MTQQATPLTLPKAEAIGRARRTPWKRFVLGGIGGAALAVIGASSFFIAYPERAPVALDRTIENLTG